MQSAFKSFRPSIYIANFLPLLSALAALECRAPVCVSSLHLVLPLCLPHNLSLCLPLGLLLSFLSQDLGHKKGKVLHVTSLDDGGGLYQRLTGKMANG